MLLQSTIPIHPTVNILPGAGTWQSKPFHHLLPPQGDVVVAQTREHSWYGACVHVVRHDGKIVRAVVGPLMVFERHWGLCCYYYNSSKRARKPRLVSPLSLFVTEDRWQRCEILSDQDETSITPAFQSDVTKDVCIRPGLCLLSTPLTLDYDSKFSVPAKMLNAIEWAFKELQLLQKL